MATMVERLDPTRRSAEAAEFATALRRSIVGQDEGVQAVVDLYQVFRAGLNVLGRPVGNLLFLGPTGSGKTRIVEATAEVLFGDSRAVLKVDCAEFQHSHEIAKLIGSPPGYLGHRETHPLITQDRLEEPWSGDESKPKLSLLLFDEIEKASDALWQLLLGILDKATLTLGDNRRVDLSQTLIFMTSNLGGTEITELMRGGLGFVQPDDRPANELDTKVDRTAREAARRKFSPEFMNRLDKIVVFHALQSEQLEQVLDIELRRLQDRVLADSGAAGGRRFLIHVTGGARRFLLHDGTDVRYGARHLKRSIERNVVYPLANLLATAQVSTGDLIRVDWSPEGSPEGHLDFWKEAEGALIPITPEKALAAAAAPGPAGEGHPVEEPAVVVAKTAPVACYTQGPELNSVLGPDSHDES